MKNLFLDTETNAMTPGSVCQLAAILETEAGYRGINYFFSVNYMEDGASKVNGLTIESLSELSNGEGFNCRAQEIKSLIDGATVIAHNEPFDSRFLATELARCGMVYSPASRNCTMQFFSPILKLPYKNGNIKKVNLEELLNYYGVPVEKVKNFSEATFGKSGGGHDARFDTSAIYIVTNIYRESICGTGAWQRTFCG